MTPPPTRQAPNEWELWLRQWGATRFQLSTKSGWNHYVNAASRPRPALLSRSQMRALGEEELEDYNEARCVWNANPVTIHTPQLAATFGLLDEVMASNSRDADRLRGSAVIDAAPALGKTTIATSYARRFHRKAIRRGGARTPEGHQRLPVVYVPLSAGATLKGLNQKILRFYGHPAATRSSRAELGSLVSDCILSCRTQLVIVDDVHFIHYKWRSGRELSDHLKALANESSATFVYVGVRLREHLFFDEGLTGEDAAYAQTSRRATRCEISPFSIATDAGMRAWVALLAALEEHLVLAEARPGMLTDSAELLYARTQGSIGSLTNLLDHACYRAIATGTETIDEDLLMGVAGDYAADFLAEAV